MKDEVGETITQFSEKEKEATVLVHSVCAIQYSVLHFRLEQLFRFFSAGSDWRSRVVTEVFTGR